MAPLASMADWEVTMALGCEMHYEHPGQIMDEIARLTPTFAGVSYEKLDVSAVCSGPVTRKPRRAHQLCTLMNSFAAKDDS